MAIVRFLDPKKQCCELSSPNDPILIYLTEQEKEQLKHCPTGDCMMLINEKLPEHEIQEVAEKLNETKDPRRISR